MSGIGIVCALALEARHFGCNGAGAAAGAIHRLPDGSLLACSGMGAAAATSTAEQLAAARVRGLVSWGVAGGLDPALAAGTLCLPGEVVSLDGNTVSTATRWISGLAPLLATRRVICGGRLLSVAEPAVTASRKAGLFRQTGARAVDMESAAIARVAAARGLPFIAVRVIADTALDSLPRVIATVARQKELRYRDVLGALLATPAEIPRVARLAWRYHAADRALRHLARVCISARYGLEPVLTGVAP